MIKEERLEEEGLNENSGKRKNCRGIVILGS
jgi:hypothetical protein